MIYQRMSTKVIAAVGERENFEGSVGLHQGSALSPFLFVLVMNVLTEKIRNEELWALYTDDLVITTESEEDLQRRVGEWQKSLERGDLKVNVNKAKVLVSCREDRGRTLIQVEKFKYLGSTLSQEGGCEAEVDSLYKMLIIALVLPPTSASCFICVEVPCHEDSSIKTADSESTVYAVFISFAEISMNTL
ncbi:uncharacterized protein LOC135197441 [Macrobrachium nipponense]|uniref:uncharacterized protein LOC135197441 n=1 Tax=Macrobrachium nipponense TaxID=159736 RepID=UPI0030C7FF64